MFPQPEPLLIKYVAGDVDNALAVIPSNYGERRLVLSPHDEMISQAHDEEERDCRALRVSFAEERNWSWAPYKRRDLLDCRLVWRSLQNLGIWQESRRVS